MPHSQALVNPCMCTHLGLTPFATFSPFFSKATIRPYSNKMEVQPARLPTHTCTTQYALSLGWPENGDCCLMQQMQSGAFMLYSYMTVFLKWEEKRHYLFIHALFSQCSCELGQEITRTVFPEAHNQGSHHLVCGTVPRQHLPETFRKMCEGAVTVTMASKLRGKQPQCSIIKSGCGNQINDYKMVVQLATSIFICKVAM